MRASLMLLWLGLALPVAAQPLDLLHWWTSGSEAQTLGEVRQTARAAGVDWRESPVAGAGNANTLLKTRFLSGHPPALAQLDKAVWVWGEAVPLADLTAVARSQRWGQVLPAAIYTELLYQDKAVAVPINVHRLNSLWSNTALLKRHGLAVPRTWPEFFAAAEVLQTAGVIPLAIGGTVGQQFSVFANVVLGQGGPAFFRQALVKGDATLLGGPQMLAMLRDFKRVKRYTDAGQVGRDWAVATSLLIQGKAAMQFTGDWANGEFLKAGWVAGRDYECTAAPGHGDLHYFEFDRILFFKPASPAQALQQARLAEALLQPEASMRFARSKGGIPVRVDADLAGFNACAQRSYADFKKSGADGRLTLALGAQLPEATHGAYRDVVAAFWASDRMTAEQAQARLVKAARVVD
ncbi:ABC transporter substrate-binding protein [Paucibacter sp. O1-1]|nr:ABC transporter substrate-binding protein [Paucibacter sp. O1-1]MDA3827403.1 ABC transporter substrate-binding protein [Paucibacter sp. O1-1]